MNKLNKIVLLVCWVGITILPDIAITQPVDPLIIDRQDPLIPKGYGRRELSSFEKYRIQKEIANLDKAAKDELDRGNTSYAMELWYRRLRLTRLIDTKAEIKALGKVGAIAWSENLGIDVRNIANRLIAIQTEKSADRELSPELLNDLASAYESVRYLDKAIDVYQQKLVKDKARKGETLDKLGELYLGIFDYENAALVYQEKLAKNAPKDREVILKTLIDIYDSAGETDRSITTKKRLIEQYIEEAKHDRIPALEIAIARDYETLKQDKKAIATYSKAFETASKTKQLAIANDALIRLGKLYQKQSNLEQAIDTYNKLLTIQQQSYNYYGLINTYDTLGSVYLKLSQPKKAKQSFQQGLDIAQTIDYKVDYFSNKIKML